MDVCFRSKCLIGPVFEMAFFDLTSLFDVTLHFAWRGGDFNMKYCKPAISIKTYIFQFKEINTKERL